MANEKHLAILEQGVDAWNAWREENPVTEPDLLDADLSGKDLRGANLSGAMLDGAYLVGAYLSRANLRKSALRAASLGYTDLRDANLEGAYLEGAGLGGANLGGANLSGAYLVATHLGNTNLNGANFKRTVLLETVFANADLSNARDLGACYHAGPSIIDHRTIQRSDTLPLSFLRGCGLPDTLIQFLLSLPEQPIQFYSCFISYSSKDDAFARRLYADLQDNHVRCWFAPEDMKIGDKIRTRIDEVIRFHQKLLLVLSEGAIGSAWVEKEVETAFERERETKEPVLFPVRLDDAVMDSKAGWAADIKRSRHIGDFSRWKEHDAYQKSLERLLRDLKVEAEPSER